MATLVKYRYRNEKQWREDVVIGGRPIDIAKVYLEKPEVVELHMEEIADRQLLDVAERPPLPERRSTADKLMDLYDNFDQWFEKHWNGFNQRTAWAFTNGNKMHRL